MFPDHEALFITPGAQELLEALIGIGVHEPDYDLARAIIRDCAQQSITGIITPEYVLRACDNLVGSITDEMVCRDLMSEVSSLSLVG